jgi:MoaA/NifB/PqqE/SkfB family radical SAM enzyme
VSRLEPRPRAHAALAGGALPPALTPEDPITRLPILILYPHERCNCRCVMCDIWKSKGRNELAPEEVDGWMPELLALGVERVVLSGGEALLHARLQEMCARLSAAGIGITLITTGLLLSRDAGWLPNFVDDVIVSLDGPPDVHDRIRNVPRAYQRLSDGVEALRSADLESTVRVSARCTVQRINHDRLCDTVDAARAADLDGVSFLAADVSSDAFNRPGGWDAARAGEVALDASQLDALAAEIDRLEREHAGDFASGFIAESPEKLRARILGHFAALQGRGDFARQSCNAPWVSTVIEADGTVRPCFFHAPIGNVREAGSLGAVLNSPAARAWRAGLDVRANAICKRCVCSLTLRESGVAAAS